MIIEGLISIAEGEHPRNISEKLNGFELNKIYLCHTELKKQD